MVEEVDRELQAQQSIVASAEAQNLAKLGALERALRLYRDRLGLHFRQGKDPVRGSKLRVWVKAWLVWTPCVTGSCRMSL